MAAPLWAMTVVPICTTAPCDLCNPRSRGCGRQQRLVPHRRSLVPGLVNTPSLTPNARLFPDAMHVQDGCSVHGLVDQRHWRKEGKHPGCCGKGRQTFGAGSVLVRIAQSEADLPLEPRRPP
jgi:hypothetical protein